QNADGLICEKFGLTTPQPDLTDWNKMLDIARNPDSTVEIAVVGAHHAMSDSYKSIFEGLFHGGIANRARIRRREVDSTSLTEENAEQLLAGVSGVVVPDGAGKIGCAGSMAAIRWARENKVPFLGIGLGMELAAVEFAKNAAGLSGAYHAGIEQPGVELDPDQEVMTKMVGEDESRERSTMRKGLYACALSRGTLVRCGYRDAELVRERHRNEYELNPALLDTLTDAGMVVSGINPDSQFVEAFEMMNHPWFVGVIYHPEFRSRPVDPHPLFAAFIAAAGKKAHASNT
ncbi:MAG: hypothetical protein LIP23_03765, partial [Planctomycetes bacterium]|nr:hypothetical protein [Planctomycetota bacterium]